MHFKINFNPNIFDVNFAPRTFQRRYPLDARFGSLNIGCHLISPWMVTTSVQFEDDTTMRQIWSEHCLPFSFLLPQEYFSVRSSKSLESKKPKLLRNVSALPTEKYSLGKIKARHSRLFASFAHL